MDTNSTSKMLAQMNGQRKSNRPVEEDVQEIERIDTPKLQPVSEMAQALAQILGPSFTKDYSPLD